MLPIVLSTLSLGTKEDGQERYLPARPDSPLKRQLFFFHHFSGFPFFCLWQPPSFISQALPGSPQVPGSDSLKCCHTDCLEDCGPGSLPLFWGLPLNHFHGMVSAFVMSGGVVSASSVSQALVWASVSGDKGRSLYRGSSRHVSNTSFAFFTSENLFSILSSMVFLRVLIPLLLGFLTLAVASALLHRV